MPESVKIDIDNLPVVAIVGRVNVGKSTLFNRLIEKDKAIVSDIPGTTRTSNEGLVLWRGKYFRLIDTGGLTFEDKIPFEKEILKQSQNAMKEADVILFVIDGKTDILPQEKELAKYMRHIIIKPVILIANKVDTNKIESNLLSGEWYKLGLGEPVKVSAANGRNTGDMLDHVFSLLQKSKRRPKTKAAAKAKAIRVSLIGKPNVGKSSLFNKLIGEERVIVSELAHTTREPYDTDVIYSYQDGKDIIKQKIIFVDTAGIRRKANVAGKLERQGIFKSIEAVEQSNIVLFVLDGSEPISSQDMQLGGLVEKRGKSVVLLINKWDLAEDNSDTQRQKLTKIIYSYFPHLKFAPIIFVSGKTGLHAHQIMPLIIRTWKARHTEISTSALEQFLAQVVKQHRPARGKGTRHPQVLGFKQLHNNPPIFEMLIKAKTSVHFSYVHYIENRLREQFGFFATPIVIKLTKVKK